MDDKRWKELERTGGPLTPEEIASGCHWCPDWDYMLITPDMDAIHSCTDKGFFLGQSRHCGEPTSCPDGPEFSDGCSLDGFPGGCRRMGCHVQKKWPNSGLMLFIFFWAILGTIFGLILQHFFL